MSWATGTSLLVGGFLASAVRVGTPLLLAATGEMLTERAGVINLGVEGAMLGGALASALGAMSFGVWGGVILGMVAGMCIALVFGAFVVIAKVDQIICGTAITLGVVGLTGTAYRQTFGAAGPGLSIPTFASLPVPALHDLPVLGPALFTQPLLTYFAFLAIPVTWWMLFRTHWGLSVRATGESSEAARAAGIRTRGLQLFVTVIGGGFAGLAGATLVLAQVGTFAERMTAGRGFIAIAIVVLGRWHPVGVLIASLLFGVATALQFLFQALGLAVPYQLFLMLPYVLALVALAGAVGRVRAPAGLGK